MDSTLSQVNNTVSPVVSDGFNRTASGPSNTNAITYGASGPLVLGIVWALTVVAAGCLGARLFVKNRHNNGFWWDDHLLVASWFMLALFAAMATYCVSVGLGSHSHSRTVQQSPLQLGVIIATVLSVLGAAWSKTSFALTLLRITRTGSRVLYWSIWCVVVTMNVVLVFNAILQFIWCVPAKAAWNADLEGRCWDRRVAVQYTQFAAYYSAAMDFALAIVPFAVIAKLSMRVKEKLGVIFCMSQAGQLFIWTGAELACTIVAASIPVLRVLVSEIKQSRYPGVTELNTFRSLGEGGGIHVTKETIISRSASKVDRSRKLGDDEEDLLTPVTPMTPGPTYHSFVKA